MSSMGSSHTFASMCQLLLLYLLVWLFGSPYLEIIKPSSCSGNLNFKCKEMERRALLTFKEGLTDPSGRLSSWVGEDCCNWKGVGCSNKTGHVLKLDLRNQFELSGIYELATAESVIAAYKMSCLGGKLTPSLLNLKRLNYLDLSLNNFEGSRIPIFIGSLKNLSYLNLSFASFAGEIPHHLRNLSSLRYLDLYAYSYSDSGSELYVKSLNLLSGLSSLEYLDMGHVDLSRVGANWIQAANMLPSLLELHLSFCRLSSISPSLPSINLTSLSVLNISHNSMNSSIPPWLFNLTSLSMLDLSNNNFRGSIPETFANLVSLIDLDLSGNNIQDQVPRALGNLCKLQSLDLSFNSIGSELNEFMSSLSSCANNSLEVLDLRENRILGGNLPESIGNLKNMRSLLLSWNSFWGSILSSIGNLSSLQVLDLSNNQMNGTIPEGIGQLSELVELQLSENSWEGVITEAHFFNLTRLENLDIRLTIPSKSSLIFNVRNAWAPPFSLKSIRLDNCQAGPRFSIWLQTQMELTYVSLSNVGILDTIPGDWFSKLSSRITDLDLSNNQFRGKLPQPISFPEAHFVDLSSNLFEGPLPLWPTNVTSLRLNLNNNLFSGPIPQNIGNLLPGLEQLQLSGNSLIGSIPSSISKLRELQVLVLKNNRLSGQIPRHWENLQNLRVVDMANNSLFGNIPSSMGSLSSLQFLLLSDNNLDGELPSSLQNCGMMNSIDLGGNRLSGKVPTWIGERMFSLLMLRLRSNLFSGEIPQELCLLSSLHILDLAYNNFSGPIPKCLRNLSALVYGFPPSSVYKEYMKVASKGLVNSIDLSRNNLRGEIPDSITGPLALGNLNLSMNHLTGSIPKTIGNMQWLHSLDLSNNQLSGSIPESISSLTSLSHLDLSYNNLSGKIPSGNQLQTLDDSSNYEGNPLLCGFPLSSKCQGDETSQRPAASNGGDGGGETSQRPATSNIGGDGGVQDHDENDSEMLWFYASILPGFATGFWAFCGTLIIKRSWRRAYFQFFDHIKERIILMILLSVARLKRTMGSERN